MCIYIYFVRLVAKYFILRIVNVNDTVLLISNSTCSLLIYRKEIDFIISTLCIATLLKLHFFFQMPKYQQKITGTQRNWGNGPIKLTK